MKEYWTTRDGKLLNIREKNPNSSEYIQREHLENICSFLIGQNKKLADKQKSTVEKYNELVNKYNSLVDEYNKLNGRSFVSLNGDMAQFFNEQQQDRVYNPNPNLPW